MLGLVLLGRSLWNFGAELNALSVATGPALAFVSTATVAVGTGYVGYWLSATDLDPAGRQSVAVWCLGGFLAAASVFEYTVVVRVIEGRTVPEPLFPGLLLTGAGAVVGAYVGSLYAQSRAEAARAREVREAVAFTNSALRHDVANSLQVLQTHTDIARSAAEADLPEHLRVDGTDALGPVFANLLNNAVQHTPADVHVTVEARHDGDRAVVTVAEDGPGVPPARRDTILEREVSKAGGGGLGLHIVSTVVDRLDADIRVTDGSLGGTAFVVKLPAAR